MGLDVRIDLGDEIRKTGFFFDHTIKDSVIVKSARQAINRAAQSMKSFSNRQIREERKLKLREIADKIRLKKAQGKELIDLEATVTFSGIPLPLILFVAGAKQPREQKGIPVGRRKRLKVEIKRGQKKTRQHLFIARAKRGEHRYQVFQRASSGKSALKMQSAPSIAEMLRTKRNIKDLLERHALTRLKAEFEAAYNFNMSKAKL